MSFPNLETILASMAEELKQNCGWLFLRLKTRVKENQSDVRATKTYQLKIKETIAKGEE